MSALALIPARGGSKGLPGKNIRLLDGHPLIAYAVEAAKQSKRVDRIICSTDSEEIAVIARKYGAETPFVRPMELAKDDSPDIGVFQHALDWLAQNENWRPEIVANVRPTAPGRRPDQLDQAIKLLQVRPDVTSVRSVCLAPITPYKMWTMTDNELLQPLLSLDGVDEPFNQARQSLPDVWWQTAQIDVVRASVIIGGGMSGPVVAPLVVDLEQAVDIDDLQTFELAEKAIETLPDCIRPES